MVCCALIALVIAGLLYLARVIIPGLSNIGGPHALSWRASDTVRGQKNVQK